MKSPIYPKATRDVATERTRLAPAQAKAFRALGEAVYAAGALDVVTKQLIAVAVAHVTQCPYCIRSHTRAAMREGATSEQIMEAIWVAAEMRAGAAYAHSVLALDTMAQSRDDMSRGSDDRGLHGAIRPNPPRTTTGRWFAAPKFGSAGSGGLELEPGPERD